MSPEQLEAGEVDHRSDIFAVGAVCYELLSYTEAFAGADTRQVERRVMAGKPVPLASLVPGIDPEIDEIIQRALKKDPNKRYQDAATFEKALERVRARLGADDPPGSARPTPPPPQSDGRQVASGQGRSRVPARARGRSHQVARGGAAIRGRGARRGSVARRRARVSGGLRAAQRAARDASRRIAIRRFRRVRRPAAPRSARRQAAQAARVGGLGGTSWRNRGKHRRRGREHRGDRRRQDGCRWWSGVPVARALDPRGRQPVGRPNGCRRLAKG